MSELALRTTSFAAASRRLAEAGRQFALGIAEGIAAARRYEKLAAMSDAELARLGITRGDAAWYALCGEPRPR